MLDELKPCPACFSTDTFVSNYWRDGSRSLVVCNSCEMNGPWKPFDKDAIAAWNALPRANDSKYRRALDLLGVPAQALKDPDKAPPLRIDVRMAREVMGVING